MVHEKRPLNKNHYIAVDVDEDFVGVVPLVAIVQENCEPLRQAMPQVLWASVIGQLSIEQPTDWWANMRF